MTAAAAVPDGKIERREKKKGFDPMTENTKEPVYASKAKPWLKYYDEKYIHQTVPECSAFELICRSNERHLGDTALEYYGRKFSYADLIVQVKKTAAALQALGVKKGDIITVVSVMTPEVVYTFYAADLLGATLNLVDPRSSTPSASAPLCKSVSYSTM